MRRDPPESIRLNGRQRDAGFADHGRDSGGCRQPLSGNRQPDEQHRHRRKADHDGQDDPQAHLQFGQR
jgi:hypothetical protein